MYLLLGTAGCHLCEQAAELIAEAIKTRPIEIIEIDIAEQTQWQADYALRIPVLYHISTGRDLSWPFNIQQLLNFINELTNDN